MWREFERRAAAFVRLAQAADVSTMKTVRAKFSKVLLKDMFYLPVTATIDSVENIDEKTVAFIITDESIPESDKIQDACIQLRRQDEIVFESWGIE